MKKLLLLYVRNIVIFLVGWNLILMIFRQPYVFRFVSHIVIPVVIAVIATIYTNWQNSIVNAAMPKEVEKKKWDPYNHD